MPKITKTFTHNLGKDEAVRRLRERISTEKINKSNVATVTKEVWTDPYNLDFAMSVLTYRIDGALHIDDSEVKLELNLPFGAMMFKGMVESQIGQQMELMLN